jgi:hypothetical protein
LSDAFLDSIEGVTARRRIQRRDVRSACVLCNPELHFGRRKSRILLVVARCHSGHVRRGHTCSAHSRCAAAEPGRENADRLDEAAAVHVFLLLTGRRDSHTNAVGREIRSRISGYGTAEKTALIRADARRRAGDECGNGARILDAKSVIANSPAVAPSQRTTGLAEPRGSTARI